jgi:hypothetical protein
MRHHSGRVKHRDDLFAARSTATACAAAVRDFGHAGRTVADQTLDRGIGNGGAMTDDHGRIPILKFIINFMVARQPDCARARCEPSGCSPVSN